MTAPPTVLELMERFTDNFATVLHHGKTLTLRYCDRGASVNEKKFDLGVVVMLDKDDPVLPIKSAAEALGIKTKVNP